MMQGRKGATPRAKRPKRKAKSKGRTSKLRIMPVVGILTGDIGGVTALAHVVGIPLSYTSLVLFSFLALSSILLVCVYMYLSSDVH